MSLKGGYRQRAIVFVSTVLLLGLGMMIDAGFSPAKQIRPNMPLARVPDALIEPGSGPKQYILVVEKTSQSLFIYQYLNQAYYLPWSYGCTTGENIGDKQVEGDKKTPEGFYIFTKKSLEQELAPIYGVLAYPMDYPNFWDQHLGKGGTGIWLHGTNRPRVPRDSNGCIALENIDLIELEPILELYNTPVIIYDKIKYEPVEVIRARAVRIRAFIESWRRAWEGKNFSVYQSRYSKNFINNDGKDFKAWMAHKAKLNERYNKIRVRLSNLRIFRHQGRIVVTFHQDYRGGENFVSQGEKRLYLQELKNGNYKIIGEVWHPSPEIPKVNYLSAELKEKIRIQGRLTQVATASEPQIKTAAKPAPSLKNRASSPVKIAKAAQTVKDKPNNASAKPGPASEPNPSNERLKVKQAVETWLNAWRKQDLDQYLKHYHPDFRYKGMDLPAYRAYKEELKAKYRRVRITVNKLKIKVNGSKAKVTFVQDYKSDKYQDHGLKTLFLSKSHNNWRIVEESWQDMSAGAKP